MKAAFQKDEALLADIASTRQRGGSRVWWLGQSGFLVLHGETTVLFDPYLSDSLTAKYADTDKPHVRITERVIDPARLTGIDVITSSHNHTDHLDAGTLTPLFAANLDSRLVIPAANRDFVLKRLGSIESRLVELDAGQSAELNGLRLHGIPAAHNAVERDEQGRHRFLGFVAEFGDLTIYHSGDTLWHDGLVPALHAFQIDVAFLPINGNVPERRVAGNLDGIEAARLAAEIGAGVVVPHHFDLFEFNTASPAEFEAECRSLKQTFATLRNGEGLNLEPFIKRSKQS